MADSDLKIKVSADTSDAQKEIGGLQKVLGGLGSGLGTALKVGAGVAAAGIVGLVGGIAASVGEAMGAEEAMASLNQVLTSTKGAAGVSADAAAALATQLQGVTKYSDETILSAEAMILRFEGIGKDIFPEVTKTALDMATSLKTDPTSAAQLLGKSLSEMTVNSQGAVTGLDRLRRYGVSFSDSQEKAVAAAVKSGDQMKAQQLVLEELRKGYAGAAEAAGNTFSGKLTILQNKFSDILETVGGAFLPLLTDVAKGISGVLSDPAVLAGIMGFANTVRDVLTSVVGGIRDFITTFQAEGIGGAITQLFGNLGLGSDLAAAAGNLAQTLSEFISTALNLVPQFLSGKIDLQTLLTGLFGGGAIEPGGFLQGLLGGLMENFNNFINFIQTQLAPALASAFGVLVEAALPVLQQLGEWVTANVLPALQELGNIVGPMLQTGFQMLGSAVVAFIPKLADFIANIIKFLPTLGEFAAKIGDGIGRAIQETKTRWDSFMQGLQAAGKFISDMIGFMSNLEKTLRGGISEALTWFNDTILQPLLSTFQSIATTISDVIGYLQGLADMLGLGVPGLRDAFNTMFGGGRAAGGPVSFGRSYLVGEQGPELFVPGRNGMIVPNGNWGGAPVQFVYSPTFSLADRYEAEEVIRPILESILRK